MNKNIIKEKGYIIDIEKESITTPIGYVLDKQVLSNVSTMYERLKLMNSIHNEYINYGLGKTEEWSLATEIHKLMTEHKLSEITAKELVMNEYIISQVIEESYIENDNLEM